MCLRAVANNTIRRRVAILLCATGVLAPSQTESLKGVVFSDHSGEGPHRTGVLQLAVGNEVHDLVYDEPVPRRFRNNVCWDIRAIWSVVVRRLDSGWEISNVSCAGQVEEDAHGSWLVARDYLQTAGSQTSPSSLLSLRWRSSASFKDYAAKIEDLDLSNYRLHGRPGRCVDVLQIARPDRTQLRAGGDCFLRISGKAVDLLFSVVRNTQTGHWEIDEIKIE